ncbi:hypothetical protein TNCV_1087991 [Trichonephila clavipes]|uniref:Uncharacterized protein n=1 Tax=Trichonephila clavipes TaxID=2585209 RepID=A0A8X6SX10_TRICX|nr:hypothetical protein TNCV_1087991 [Trichonephila clavipes]
MDRSRDRPVIKAADSSMACYEELEPSVTEDPPCRGGQYMLDLLRVKRSPFGWCGVNINVALFIYTRAFGCGPRHFELWSNDEDDT